MDSINVKTTGVTIEGGNRAIIKVAPTQAAINDVPIPSVRPGYMLVRTHAVALNPADWTDIDYDDYNGCVVGIDYSGVVVEVGEGINKPYKPGDRVAGICHGCNKVEPTDGAFAQYILVKGDMSMHIPESMEFEAAAALGSGVLSASMGLFIEMGLPLPSVEPGAMSSVQRDSWVLVYGGSSATGSMAIQFAKLAGYKVVTTCSPHNFELAKDRGADAVFDYRTPNVAQAISDVTSNSLVYAFDTIATDETAIICTAAFAHKEASSKLESEKAIYVTTLDPSLPPQTAGSLSIEKRFFLGYTSFGEYFEFEGEEFAASLKDYDFAVNFGTLAETLLRQGKLKNHPVTVNMRGRGLEGVLEGLEVLKAGKVSGSKLVYNLQ